jgi:hypothetical protein
MINCCSICTSTELAKSHCLSPWETILDRKGQSFNIWCPIVIESSC